MECPRCGSENVTYSHRRGPEKVLRYVYPWMPYRCKECWSRFWRFNTPFRTRSARIAAGVIIVLLLVLLFLPLGLLPDRDQGPPAGDEPDTPRPVASPVAEIEDEVPDPEVTFTPPPVTTAADIQEEDIPSPSGGTGGTQIAGAAGTAEPEPEPSSARPSGGGTRPAEEVPPAPEPTPVSEPSGETPAAPADTAAAEPPPEPGASPEPDVSPEPAPEVPVDIVATAEKVSGPGIRPEARRPSPPRPERPVSRMVEISQQAAVGAFKMSFVADSPVAEYEAFQMSDPPRFVINLKGDWENAGRSRFNMDSELVERVRVGEHPDHLSVVLDLKQKVDRTPVIAKTDKGFTLTLEN